MRSVTMSLSVFNVDCAVEVACLGRVLILATDHRIVEEIFHILIVMVIATTLDQVYRS
jgi:hypothetical protein